MPTAMPTSSTIGWVRELMGTRRSGKGSREIAPITAVPASSSGIPAAISAPNTISSSASDTGTDVISDWRKSWPTSELVARSTLASPASATVSPGYLAATAATALSAGTTVVSSLFGLPATLNVTRAALPLVRPEVVNGELMSAAAPGSLPSAATTLVTAWRICGSLARVRPGERAWTSTDS